MAINSSAQKGAQRLSQKRLSEYWGAVRNPRPGDVSQEQHFRFMDLPFAIRREIYLLLLDLEPGQIVGLNSVPRAAEFSVDWTLNHPYQVSPPSTSSPVNQERAVGQETGERRAGAPIENKEWGSDWTDRPAPAYRMARRLLRACKTIRDEARSIIFSEHVIAVNQTWYGGLQALEEVDPAALRALRALVVRMQPCKCLTPYCAVAGWPAWHGEWTTSGCGNWWVDQSLAPWPQTELRFFGHYPDPPRSHARPLDPDRNRFDRAALDQWERICSKLAAHASPWQLRLFLICEVDDLNMARRVVAPMLKLSGVRHVGICFGRLGQRADEFRKFAKETALHVQRHRALDETPFPFFDLPVELQMQVLEHTELGVPRRASWPTQINGGKVCLGRLFRRQGHFQCHRPFCSCRWYDDKRYCPSQDEREEKRKRQRFDLSNWPVADDTRRFFSDPQFGGFHTASLTEAAGKLSLASWFRVSRDFGDRARSVFYSRVVFEVCGSGINGIPTSLRIHGGLDVHDDDDDDDDGNNNNNYYQSRVPNSHWWKDLANANRLSTLRDGRRPAKYFLCFIRTIGSPTLAHVRKLSLVFPGMLPSDAPSPLTPWRFWLKTIDAIAEAANLPQLELNIVFAGLRHPSRSLEGVDEYGISGDKQLIEAQEAKMAELHRWIMEPLRKLKALKALFVYTSWPFGCDDRVTRDQVLEKFVMGQSYDSSRCGKPPQSIWVQAGEYLDMERFNGDNTDSDMEPFNGDITDSDDLVDYSY